MTKERKRVTPEALAASGTEDGEQAALFCYAAEQAKRDPRWGLLYAIPNGGQRDPATAARMKATGTKAGFPDIGFPYTVGSVKNPELIEVPGLFIELKRRKIAGKQSAGRLQVAQAEWATALCEQGYLVMICYGWEDAVNVITEYLKGSRPGGG